MPAPLVTDRVLADGTLLTPLNPISAEQYGPSFWGSTCLIRRDDSKEVPMVASGPGWLITRAAIPTMTITIDTFMTGGFATGGDKGAGAIYTRVGASPSGPMAIQDAGGTWFQLVITDIVRAGWFGVTADGVTNDSTALQAAIDYVASINGGKLQLSRGTTLANVVLKRGVQIFGAEGIFNTSNSTILKAFATGAVIDSPVSTISTASVTGVSIIGLGSGVPCVGVHLRAANWCKIQHCFFDQFADEAILWDAGFALELNSLLVENTLLNRTRASPSGCVTINGSDSICFGCEVTASVTGGKTANGNCAAWLIGSANHFFVSCIGEISDTGWDCSTNAPFLARWVNCRADTNEMNGWDISGFYNSFDCCTSYNDGQDATNTYYGFRLHAASKSTLLTGCTVTGGTTLSACYKDTSNNSNPVERNKIVNCQGDNFGPEGQFFFAVEFGTSSYTPANGMVQATSGGTITVDAVQVVALNYASPTNVTNFVSGQDSVTLRVLGDGNVTVVNGSTIKTNTAANKLLAANKVYTFTSINGIWYENA